MTAIIKADSFKLIYYYFTMNCEGNHDSWVCCLFPAAGMAPSAKTHTIAPHLSEHRTSSSESKREWASKRPKQTSPNVYTLFHKKVHPTIILLLCMSSYFPHLIIHLSFLKLPRVFKWPSLKYKRRKPEIQPQALKMPTELLHVCKTQPKPSEKG